MAQLSRSLRNRLLFFWNFYPPFFGSGIWIEKVAPDFSFVRVKLKKRPWTSNYVGTQFGGAMFMMTDPFFMVMLLKRLGSAYVVWDKAATIQYVKPGRTEVHAEFKLDDTVVAAIRDAAAGGEKLNWNFSADIVDTEGSLIAKVEKVIYIRLKSTRM